MTDTRALPNAASVGALPADARIHVLGLVGSVAACTALVAVMPWPPATWWPRGPASASCAGWTMRPSS